VRVRAEDGVELSGIVVPALPGAAGGSRPVTFVLAHGFTNSVSREPFRRLAGWLRAFGEVRALDSRGHGRSGGGTTVGGDPEMADVDAAVRAARADGADAVVTLGLSMGGGVALRQAALGAHRPDAVVSVSAVSRWYVRETAPMRRVHGDRDEYFPLEHFRALVQAAGPAATAWVVPGMGHAENGMTGPLAERIGRWACAAVAGPDTAGRPDPVLPPSSATIVG
jgi:pimeloyl-ACP methyl ester carboxylesterase